MVWQFICLHHQAYFIFKNNYKHGKYTFIKFYKNHLTNYSEEQIYYRTNPGLLRARTKPINENIVNGREDVHLTKKIK